MRALSKADRVAAILGACDGLTLAVSLIFGRNPAVFHAALDAGIGEFVGMGAAVYLSATKRELLPALLCGLSTTLACVLPATPYLVARGPVALAAASVAACVGAAIVARLREERGWVAIAETYGVLAAAALLCWAVSFIGGGG